MGNSSVPASNASGSPITGSEMPQSTILADEAMLLTSSTATNAAMIRS